MSLILYYATSTRAFRARWVLEELGVPYELRLVDIAHGEQRTPAYRSIHPLGAVPALIDDETIVFESAAIALHLGDKFPEHGLAPEPGSPTRALYYQWSVFAVATLDPLVAPVFARGMRWAEERRHETATDDEHERFRRAVHALRPTLSRGPFLLGASFSIADVLVGSVLSWAKTVGLMRSAQELEAYLARLEDRPGHQRALIDDASV